MSMKVLAIADRRPMINILEVVEQEKIELIITLGDLTREDILPLERITHIPKIGVYGNHDSGNYMEELGIWDMHLKVWDFNGLRFGGFQGCVRYKADPTAIMYTQEEAETMMAGFPPVDVFLAHCPPFGINDEEEIAHQGFKALRNYIDQSSPRVLMHGHTYPTEDTVVTQHGHTRIEYVFEYKIVEV
jgi:Icc-related predicted phosphoesterase